MVNFDDLRRQRQERLARARSQLAARADRVRGRTQSTPGIVRPQTEEEALSGFPELQVTPTPDVNEPLESPARTKMWGQSVVDHFAKVSEGTAAKEAIPVDKPVVYATQGLFNVMDWSGDVAKSIARPVLFGAQNWLVPGQQAFQRSVNEKRAAGMSFGESLNQAYEETNLEGPTIPFFTTAFTPNGSVTIDFEDVIEVGFDPVDLAITLGTGGVGKGITTAASVSAKQGTRSGIRSGVQTAVAGSRGAGLARSGSNTVRNMIDDPLSTVTVPRRRNLLENVNPLADVKPRIAARLPSVSKMEEVSFRQKSGTRVIQKVKNVPLMNRIIGTKPAQFAARLADPSQTVGDSVAARAKNMVEGYGALGANATDAVISYVQPDRLRKAFNYDPRDGRIRVDNIKRTKAGANAGAAETPLLGDLMERSLYDADGFTTRNSYYTGLSNDQRAVLDDYRAAVDEVVQMAVDEGVLKLRKGAVPGRLWQFAEEVESGAPIEDIFHYVSRRVNETLYTDADGNVRSLVTNRRSGPRGGNRSFENSRIFELMEEGAQDGARRYADPVESLEGLTGGIYRLVGEKRVKDYLVRENQLVTSDQVLKRLHPDIVEATENAKKFVNATKANVNRLKKSVAHRAAKVPELKDQLGRADTEADRLLREQRRLVDRYAQLFTKAEDFLDKSRKATNDGLRRKYRAARQRTLGRMQEMESDVARGMSEFQRALKATNITARARTRLARLEDDMMGKTDDLATAEAELDLARKTEARALQRQTEKIDQITNSRLLDARLFGLTDEAGREVPVGRFDRGALSGSLAPLDTVDVLNKTFNDRGNNILRKIENVTGTARTLSTGTLDVGWMAIQGSLLAFTHPKLFAKAGLKSLEAIKNPAVRDAYIKKRLPQVIDFIENGGDIGSSEFFQALDRGGLLARMGDWALKKTDNGSLLGNAVEAYGRHVDPIGRLGAGFNTYLDTAKIEMWTAMSRMANGTDITKRELATHINNMMGTMNTQLLGLSPTQRQIEGALFFFSPRYTRSAYALVGDLLQSPGSIGTLDGLAQRHAMRAMGGFLAGGMATMYALGEATGQKAQLDPMKPGWLTMEVGGQTVGIGGSTRALLDLMFKATAAAAGVDNREISDLMAFNLFNPEDRRRNPLLQYWLNRTAPGVRETLTRETFDGEKLDSPVEFAYKGIAPKFLPFALDAWINPPQGVPRQEAVAFIPEIAGLRARPLSAFERRDKKRDEVAQETFGSDWADLDYDQQSEIRRDSEEVQEYEELARGVESQLFSPYFERLNRDQQIKDNAIANAVGQFRANPAGGKSFRQAYDDAIDQDRLLREIREDPNGEFATVLAKFEESQDERTDSQTEFNRIFDEYIAEVRDNPLHRDVWGNPDFDAIDESESAFREKHGQAMFDRIRRYYLGFDANGEPLRDVHPEVIALRRSREVLRQSNYWNIPDEYTGDGVMKQVWSEFQSLDSPAARQALQRRFPQLRRIERLVSRDRRQVRMRNPDVDRALVIFYGFRAVHPEVRAQERQLIQASRQLGRESTEGSFGIAQ